MINATTLTGGGGLQTAVALILESIRNACGHQWHYAVHAKVAAELGESVEQTLDLIVSDSAARHRRTRHIIERHVQQSAPDAVLTPHGPAYAKLSAPHLLGCNNGWTTVSTWLAYNTIPSWRWPLKKSESVYKGWWFHRADAWVTETSTSRLAMHERIGLPLDKIHVVPNTCGPQYVNQTKHARSPEGPRSETRILTFGTPYPHKRLEFIPDVARALLERMKGAAFKFVITLPEEHAITRCVRKRAATLGVERCIENRGPVPVLDGPQLYRSCDVAFIPSVLETFSACYPEAMAMGLPIVASNLDFARDVCDNAAVYFRANDAMDAAEKIAGIILDERLRASCVSHGQERLATFPTSRQRYEMFVKLLEEVAKQAA